MTDPESGTLYVCGTPIGNLGDASPRLLKTLGSVDVVYAEDTRRTGKLLDHFGISTKIRSLFAGNEVVRTKELVADIQNGLSVALVSDAGMPAISDPGALAVASVRGLGAEVTVIPGPSAAVMAVSLSGLGGDRFVFEGFLPKKGKDRESRLKLIANDERQVVLFVSPHRLIDDLKTLAATMGSERTIAVCRELTKLHEEAWVGTIAGSIEEWSSREPKGEFTIVIAPAPISEADPADAVSIARGLVQSGVSVSDAAREIAKETGIPRRRIYEDLLKDQGLS
jgi:16S rRNA (cytidine1402-2'-O)-methyltransferase